jgi:hypothetical protein
LHDTTPLEHAVPDQEIVTGADPPAVLPVGAITVIGPGFVVVTVEPTVAVVSPFSVYVGAVTDGGVNPGVVTAAAGVTLFDGVEAGPLPAAFAAVTVNV